MSQNPTFDEVLALVFGTLDGVYQIHAPERPEDDEDPGNCVACAVEFPCATQNVIFEGLAHIDVAMKAAKQAEEAKNPAE